MKRWPVIGLLLSVLLLIAAAGMAFGSARPDRGAGFVDDIRRDARAWPGLERDAYFRSALAAIASLDRADFVPAEARPRAYRGEPQRIGHGQTISAPIIVAVMTAAARVGPGAKVLEVGTGSGYQAAVLSRVGARVWSIEIVAPLAKAAASRLQRLKIPRVEVREGDGFAGWPEHAPFDAILVTAAAATVPQPLLQQMKAGGRLVMPIGARPSAERLLVFTKRADGRFDRCSLGPVRFVPLTGRGGRASRPAPDERGIPACF